MNTINKIVALAAIIGLAGCTTPAPQPTVVQPAAPEKLPAIGTGYGLSMIRTKVEYLDTNFTPLNVESHPNRIALLFPPVPAGIFGNREWTGIYKAIPDRQLSFELNLYHGKSQLENFAKPLSPRWAEQGLDITPEETRLVRLGTSSFTMNPLSNLGSMTGFIDTKTRDTLILLYVDRACRISGTLILDEERYDHSISIPHAGFHWIRYEQVGENDYKLQYSSPDTDANFFIMMPDSNRDG